MTKWMATLLFGALFLASAAGIAAAGTVTGVHASVASVATGTPVSVTVSGSNPCGGAFINYGDGTAITYAITGLPTTQTHAYEKPGAYTIVARGMGNCDGEVTTRIEVTGPPPAPSPGPAAAEITGVTFSPRPGVMRQRVQIAIVGHGACAFTVSFGDGNQQDVSATLPRTLSHTYSLADTYTVIVAPVAPCAGKFTDTLQVAPRGGSRITGLTIDPAPATVRRGVAIVVNGYGSCTYNVDYGDGNDEDRSKALPDRLHHVYNAADSYVIAVSGTGACQGRAERTLEVK